MTLRDIKTFVFFDLEATGLDNPRVTEIAMIAMNRSAGMEMVYEARKRLWAPSLFDCPPDLPRVQNKLTLCLYPMKPVHPDAADITGLNNDNLYQQKDFDLDVGEILNLFLRRLEPPVCLVAHNGNRYDYPLLVAELLSIGCSVSASISKEPLLCIDTFEMFRDLDGDPVTFPNKFLRDSASLSCSKPNIRPQNWENSKPQETTPKRDGCNNEEIRCTKKVKCSETENGSCEQKSNGVVSEDHSRVCRNLFPDNSSDDYDWSQSPIDISVFENENFDSAQNGDVNSKQDTAGLSASPAGVSDQISLEVLHSGHQNVEQKQGGSVASTSADENTHSMDETRQKYANCEHCAEDMYFSSLESNGSVRELSDSQCRNGGLTCDKNLTTEDKFKNQTTETFRSSFSGPITLTGSARPTRRIVGMPTKRPSYKLVDLHQRIVGYEPPASHRAEDDCIALARVFWLTPNAPLWADVNAVELDRFDPLYSVRLRRPFPIGVFPSSSG